MSVPSRLRNMFSSKKDLRSSTSTSPNSIGGSSIISSPNNSNNNQSNNSSNSISTRNVLSHGGGSSHQLTKSYLSGNISKGLIMICIELCKRKQAARVLTEIKSKECEKINLLIQNGTITPKYLNEIVDTNVLWTCLLSQLDSCAPMISGDMTEKILLENKVESIASAITNLPPHHKKLMGALIPTAEALGEGNNLLAEQILREIGSRIIEPSDATELNPRTSIETTFVRLAFNNKYLFPYTRQFYLDAGTLEIQDSNSFWDLVADHQDEGVLAHSSNQQSTGSHLLTRSASSSSAAAGNSFSTGNVMKLERTLSVPLKSNSKTTFDRARSSSKEDKDDDNDGGGGGGDHVNHTHNSPHTLFDKKRKEMNQILNSEAQIDDEDKETRDDLRLHSQPIRGRRGMLNPTSPPPDVPIPAGPKPIQTDSKNNNSNKPIFLMSDTDVKGSSNSNQTVSTDDLREIFEKCCVGRLADLSLFIRELRAAFGASSSELRSQLIEQLSTGKNSEKISWKQFLEVFNSSQLKDEKLIFLSSYRKPSDVDELEMIPSMTSPDSRGAPKGRGLSIPSSRSGDNSIGARNTPVESYYDDSELESPLQKYDPFKNNSNEINSSGEQKIGRRGRRERTSPQSGNLTIEPLNSWDSDSAGSPSPVKQQRRRSKEQDTNLKNSQNKLSLDLVDEEENSNIPVFLKPFKGTGSASPDIRRNTLNTTPANISDDILDFNEDFSPTLSSRVSKQPNRREESKSDAKRVPSSITTTTTRDLPNDDIVQSFHSEGSSLSSSSAAPASTAGPGSGHNNSNSSLPANSSPVKKGGRRGGEARKKLADMNASGDQLDLDISWDELIPTLEDDSKRKNSRLPPPTAKTAADQKLLSYAVANSAKQCKPPPSSNSNHTSTQNNNINSNSDDPPGFRNHFRRENSEASALGGPSPIHDLDMSIVPLDMLPDTCLSMDEVLSPVYQTDSPPKPEVINRRKPKPSGMFSLTAVDASQNSVEDVSIPELGVLPKSGNDPSPPGSERSAFNLIITPKSSRANSIFSNTPREDKVFFPDSEPQKEKLMTTTPSNIDEPNDPTDLIEPTEASEHKVINSLASLELVSKALNSLPKENEEQVDSTPHPAPVAEKKKVEDTPLTKKPSIKKKITGVFSSASKFLHNSTTTTGGGLLSRSGSKDLSDHEPPSSTTTNAFTRSRANSEHSIGGSSIGTHRASTTDKDDDDSVERPIGVTKTSSSVTIDVPVSSIDVAALKSTSSVPVSNEKDVKQTSQTNSTATTTTTTTTTSTPNQNQNPIPAPTDQNSKVANSGIFSKTKSLTRSASWGLKSFLGIKSSSTGENESETKSESIPSARTHSPDIESSVQAPASQVGRQVRSESPMITNSDLPSQRNSRPPSRNDDVDSTNGNSKPPLSHTNSTKNKSAEPISTTPAERNGNSIPPIEPSTDTDDLSSIHSNRSRSSVNESENNEVVTRGLQITPRTQTQTPPLSVSTSNAQANPTMIKGSSSTRSTPMKKRDWDQDNRNDEGILISNLLQNNSNTGGGSGVGVRTIVSQIDPPGKPLSSAATTPRSVELKESNTIPITTNRSIPTPSPTPPAPATVPAPIPVSVSISGPHRAPSPTPLLISSPLPKNIPPPLPLLPPPLVVNLDQRKQQVGPPIQQTYDEVSIASNNSHHSVERETIRPISNRQLYEEISYKKLECGTENANVGSEFVTPPVDPIPPIPPVSNISVTIPAPIETNSTTARSNSNKTIKESHRSPKPPPLQVIPANYLDLYRPPPTPPPPLSQSHSNGNLNSQLDQQDDHQEVHEGLYRALLYRQQVYQSYQSLTDKIEQSQFDHNSPQSKKSNQIPAHTTDSMDTTTDRNILGKRLNEKYLELKNQRNQQTLLEQQGQRQGQGKKRPSSSLNTMTQSNGKSVDQESYPPFILEVFPHLRSQRGGHKSEPIKKEFSGRDVILAIYDREERERNAKQREREPLPSHIPLHIEEESDLEETNQELPQRVRSSTLTTMAGGRGASFSQQKKGPKIDLLQSRRRNGSLVLR